MDNTPLILPPTDDWIFKLLFDDERHKDNTIALLKSSLDLPEEIYNVSSTGTKCARHPARTPRRIRLRALRHASTQPRAKEKERSGREQSRRAAPQYAHRRCWIASLRSQ